MGVKWKKIIYEVHCGQYAFSAPAALVPYEWIQHTQEEEKSSPWSDAWPICEMGGGVLTLVQRAWKRMELISHHS